MEVPAGSSPLDYPQGDSHLQGPCGKGHGQTDPLSDLAILPPTEDDYPVFTILEGESVMTTSHGGSEPASAATVSARVLKDQVAAINAHDAAQFAAFYGEDAVVRDPQYTEPLHGRDAVVNDSSVFFTAFPDLRAEVTCSVVDGSTLAAEMTLAGTHTGPLALPSGEVPPTGRALRFEMAFFARIDDHGLIVDERRYYDVADQLEQLGLGG